MSLGLRLRPLRSLITRKFPRTRSTAESSPPAVSRAAAAGAGATAAFFAGFLYYFKKDSTTSSDQSAGREVVTTTTNAAETRKEEAPVVSQATKDAAGMDDAAVRAMFMGKDGKMRWLDYVDYLTFGKTFNNVTNQKDDNEAEDAKYVSAMKARFGEWIKEFRETKTDSRDDQCWEEYVEILKAIQAHCKRTGESSVRANVIYKQLGKDCSYFEETESSIEEAFAKRQARAEEAGRRYFEEKAKKKIGK
ncbi:hypothetical protein EJB05_33524, partial [Eragrostis curvula]